MKKVGGLLHYQTKLEWLLGRGWHVRSYVKSHTYYVIDLVVFRGIQYSLQQLHDQVVLCIFYYETYHACYYGKYEFVFAKRKKGIREDAPLYPFLL